MSSGVGWHALARANDRAWASESLGFGLFDTLTKTVKLQAVVENNATEKW